MLKNASTATFGHHARGIAIDSPDARAIARRPAAANGSVSVRNVSGGISVTPSFRTGQLQPQISARIAIGT